MASYLMVTSYKITSSVISEIVGKYLLVTVLLVQCIFTKHIIAGGLKVLNRLFIRLNNMIRQTPSPYLPQETADIPALTKMVGQPVEENAVIKSEQAEVQTLIQQTDANSNYSSHQPSHQTLQSSHQTHQTHQSHPSPGQPGQVTIK